MRSDRPRTISLALLFAIPIAARLALAVPSSLVVETVQDLHSYEARLTVGADGNVYGTTRKDASNPGSVFRIDAAGNFSTIHTFPPPVALSPPESAGRLVVGHDGALYGATGLRFFRISQGVYGEVVSAMTINALTGQTFQPINDFVVGSDGAFYTALETLYCDNVGCLPPRNGVLKLETNGNATIIGGSGAGSAQPMVVGSDGALYGVSGLGFPYGNMLRWDAAGQFTVLHAFTADEQGVYQSSFFLGSDGLLYSAINNVQAGSVIRATNTGQVTLLHSFNGLDGSTPDSLLTVGSDGSMYGITYYGGSYYDGTLFRIGVNGVFTSLHSFDDSVDGAPNHPPVKARDGLLYGATNGLPTGSIFVVDNAGAVSSYPVLPSDFGASSQFVQGNDCALYAIADTWEIVAGAWRPNTTLYRAFEPSHLCQRIEFAPLSDRKFGDPPFTVSATSSSGLPISFTASGSCSVCDDQVTLDDFGLCTLTASQPGDADYEPAPEVSQLFTVPEPEQVASLWAGCLMLGVLAKRRAARTRGLSN